MRGPHQNTFAGELSCRPPSGAGDSWDPDGPAWLGMRKTEARHVIAYRAVCRIAGLALVAAALLKAASASPGTAVGSAAETPYREALASALEAALGLCLLCGLIPRAAWWLRVAV